MGRTIKIEPYYGSLKGMMAKYDALARQDAFTGNTTADYEKWKSRPEAYYMICWGWIKWKAVL